MTNQLTIRDYIAAPKVQEKMKDMFTNDRMMKQFVQSVIAIAGADELLAVAEPRSVFNACMTAASLGLTINKNIGYAHIIGYRNNKKGTIEAQFQIGAKGLKQLAQRTNQYVHINETDVREGELIGRDRLTGDMKFNWIDDEEARNKLPIVGYLSYFELKSGFKSSLYMTMDEIKAHGRQYSQAFKKGYGPWADNFDAMARKTVMKLNINRNGPMSTDLETAIVADQGVLDDEGAPKYVDNQNRNPEDERASDEQKNDIVNAHKAETEVDKSLANTDSKADDDLSDADIDKAFDAVPDDVNQSNVDAVFGDGKTSKKGKK